MECRYSGNTVNALITVICNMAESIFKYSSLFVGLTGIVLIFILVKFGTKKVHYVLALFNLAGSVCWGFGAFFVSCSASPSIALFFWKIALLGAIFAPIIFYHVIVELAGLHRTTLVRIFYIYGSLFYIVTIFDLAGLNIVKIFNSLYYVRANDYRWWCLVAVWAAILFYALSELFKLYRHSSDDKRVQYKYLLIGFIIGFTGAVLDTFPFFGINLFPVGNALIWVYCILVTYAILRHKVLDIDVILKKTLVFAGLSASVFGMLILPTLFIQEYLLGSATKGSRFLGLSISGLIIILTMRKIESFLINITDKYLFQKKYDYKGLLKTFTSEVLMVLKIDDLLNLTVDTFSDTIKVNSCAVLLFDNDKQRFYVKASRNIMDPSISLEKTDGIMTFLEHTHGYLLEKELNDKNIYIPPEIQSTMDKLSSELIIPMALHEKIIGVLSLGKKKSDEEFTQDDLDILLPLARTLAIAISNAELFEQLGKTQAEAAQKEKMAVIGTLSAGINHEICNPLGIARGQCEAFLLNMKDGLYKSKTSEELIEKAQQIMAKVIRETDRATAITKKLSSFAKPAKGESELVDINKELDEVFGLVSYELKLDKIELEKNIGHDIPPIFVDRKQFQEVLFNLLRNAGQAIGERGKIAISVYEDAGKIVIDIKDSGHGIPEDKIKQLFNPFFTTKDPGKGTGLGLFIVRQVVEKNGGRIFLKSTKVGEGTTFTIEFPISEPQTVRA